MNAGFFGLAACLIEHYRNKGNSMPSTHDETPQTRGAAPHTTPFDPVKQALEKRFVELLPEHDDPNDSLTEAMHYAVLEAGSRRCSILFMSISLDLGQDRPVLLDLASAIEFVHAASLIVEDLPCLDNRKLRHGQPSVHIKFGEDVAMLAAVALVSHAFHIVACAEGVSSNARMHLTTVLAQAAARQDLVRGKHRDLDNVVQKPISDIARTHVRETDTLLGAAIEMASIVAKTRGETTQ